jgi:hypothetical protein
MVDRHRVKWTIEGSPNRQIFDSAAPLILRCRVGYQFEIVHHLSDRDAKLVGIDDAGEILMAPQSFYPLAEQILVLRHKNPAKFRRPLQ